jgi:hypothetical protein
MNCNSQTAWQQNTLVQSLLSEKMLTKFHPYSILTTYFPKIHLILSSNGRFRRCPNQRATWICLPNPPRSDIVVKCNRMYSLLCYCITEMWPCDQGAGAMTAFIPGCKSAVSFTLRQFYLSRKQSRISFGEEAEWIPKQIWTLPWENRKKPCRKSDPGNPTYTRS